MPAIFSPSIRTSAWVVSVAVTTVPPLMSVRAIAASSLGWAIVRSPDTTERL